MTTAVESDRARCICGKLSFSHEEAEDVVRKAVVSRVLHRNARRAEQRSYPCDRNPGVWHVTSSKDSRPLTRPDGSLSLEYGPSDDTAATLVIAKVLAVGNDSHWADLLAPERVQQTRRVLVRIREEFNALKDAQGHAKELARDRCQLGEITTWDRYRVNQAYFAWREQVAPFRTELAQRLIQAEQTDRELSRRPKTVRVVDCKAAGLAHNDEHLASLTRKSERLRASLASQSDQSHRHRKAAELLALAIAQHKRSTDNPTSADLALWAVLDEVTVPHGDDEAESAAELIATGAWSPSGSSARVES